MPANLIRALVVDDSAYIRKIVSEMLQRSPQIEVVGTARNGVEALEKVAELKPDVVTLDLIMPEMDGLTFLREQMARRRLPVVVCSIASEGGEKTLAAMEAGALDFVQKPTALATERVYEIADELIEKVKAAAEVRIEKLPEPVDSVMPAVLQPRPAKGTVDAVVLGVSTGGPHALRLLIPRLPKDFPVPMAMVLHMPAGYTEMYARKLNELSALEVLEARAGDEMRPGRALLAPAGRHLHLRRRRDGRVIAHLDVRPLDTPHRPAVDVLFRTASEAYGARTLGVVMTGMGRDGTAGAAWIKAQGGIIFAEDKQTCVVYGMPRSVVEAGLVDRIVPLDGLAEAILESV